MRAVSRRIVGALLGGGLLGLCACGTESACGPGTAVVSRVIDGDTVVLQGGERVRYLLVDTPETTLGKHDCYGAEASAFNRSLVEGRTVRLTYAEACTDRYGRLLAYVSVDGSEVNTRLAREGYACVLYIRPAGESRRAEFEALESVARRERRGVWGRCSPVPWERERLRTSRGARCAPGCPGGRWWRAGPCRR